MNRMKTIVRKAIKEPVTPSTSSTESNVKKQYMKYAEKETPAQRKLRAKLEQDFEYDTTSSSDSDDNSPVIKNKSTKRRKTNQDVVRETHEVHKNMCVKAMDTLDRVNNLLGNVEKQIAQKTNQYY